MKKKQTHLPENYFFLVIGSKKKLLDYFALVFEKELILCLFQRICPLQNQRIFGEAITY